MRLIASMFFITALAVSAAAQQNGGGTVARNNGAETPVVKRDTDKEALDKAVSVSNPLERINALKTFLTEYLESDLRSRALELLSSARAEAGDTKLRAGEISGGLELFKLAVREAPDPMSDDLFSKVLVNIPTNLFLLEQRDAAFEVANIIEEMSASKPKQLLRLAAFYFTIKYATGARRLVEKAQQITPDDPLVYQSLGAAHRLGFDLKRSADAYSKAVELAPDSIGSRQNLADMKRATGNPVAAEVLYRDILTSVPDDSEANTGLALSLFEQGKKREAEALLKTEVERDPSNSFILIGAANWYAANGEPDKAIKTAQEAIEADENAIWAYIVLGRAYMKKNDPVNAEKSFLAAAGKGVSPTIAYELALARAASGFYKEAGEVLKKFFVVENGRLVTDLDGRIGVEADSFADLISLERKSSLFTEVNGYDSADDAALRALFKFENAIESDASTDEQLNSATNTFVGDDSPMRTHRQLYAASRILDAGKSAAKAAELASDAVNGVEKSVEIENATSAVLADQLYEERQLAGASGKLVVVPLVEKATLLRIMRGRIEEIAARSIIANGDYSAAQVRLKRALAVLPPESAWWRSSMWNLGSVYEKLGEDKNALASYAAGYTGTANATDKRTKIEEVYYRINGSLNGLEEFLTKKNNVQPDPASRFTKGGPDVVGSSATKKTPEVTEDAGKSAGEAATVTSLKENVDLSLAEAVKKTEIPDKTVVPENVDLSVVTNPVPTIPLPAVSIEPDVSTDSFNEILPAVIDEKPAEVKTEENPKEELVVKPIEESMSKVDPASINSSVEEIVKNVEVSSQEKTGDSEIALEDETVSPLSVEPVGVEPVESIEANVPKAGSELPVDSLTAAELIDLGATRPRIVAQEKLRAKPGVCTVVSSQDSISILSDGGSLGIVVGLINYDEAYVMRASSGSPDDISLTYEPEIGSIDGRAFFVIKSVSERKGTFSVEFDTPCGKKNVAVEVH